MKTEAATKNQMSHSKWLHRALELGIFAKAIDALFEMFGGIIFWFTSNVTLNRLVILLTQHELTEDPQDKVALFLRQSVSQFTSNARLFGGIYLIIHGFVKFWLVTNLLRRKLWAYPTTIVFLCLFILYQLYRFSYSYSIGLLALTFFDSIFTLLIWREYRIIKNT